MEALERTFVSTDWITLLLVLILFLLVVCKKLFPKAFENFIKLPLSKRYLVNDQKYKLTGPYKVLLLVVNVLSVSLFIFLLGHYFFPENILADKILFVRIALVYCTFYLAKYFLEKTVSDIFRIEKLMDNYLSYKITFRNFLSICMLPICVFFLYGHPPSDLGIVVLLCILAGINIGILGNFYRKNRRHILPQWFYFIVYLCTLEIAPYFILYKVIMNPL